MITRITAQKITLAQAHIFSFSKLNQIGKTMVTELPTVDLPVRAKLEDEDRFSKKNFYDLNNYLKKDSPPRCRYYSLQHKNRIYHVFNAYYYPMGRMISQISTAIRGKNSPLYKNNQADIKNGDICVIINASDPLFTGKKLLFKNLKYHTGFIGHLKTFSYKHVLNTKPELLYYYLLRKFMPKNKISPKYLENVHIFRGPTHNIPHLPQFAPDRNIYEYLPQANFEQIIRMHPDVKLVSETVPGSAKAQYGRDFELLNSAQLMEQQQEILNNLAEDTTILHKSASKTKQALNQSAKQIQKLKRKQNRYLDRYKQVRAPYKKKQNLDTDFVYIKDERKARKMPEYKIFVDEDMPQDDEEVVDDPYGRKAQQAKQAAIKKAQKAAEKAANKDK